MYAGAVVGRCAFGQIGTIHNSRTGQPFRFSECSILTSEMERFCVFRVNQFGSYWRCPMNKWNPEPSRLPIGMPKNWEPH